MYRYIALTWDIGNDSCAATARAIAHRLSGAPRRWTSALDCDGVLVYDSGERVGASESCRLEGNNGVVLGKLFSQSIDGSERPRRPSLTHDESELIARSEGRRLITHYWGRYVAIVRSSALHRTWVVRDPSGAMPCFHVSYKDIHILFSDIEDCLRLCPFEVSIDWQFVAAQVVDRMVQVDRTGLKGVFELQPGECLELRSERLPPSLYWTGAAAAQTDRIENPDEARTALRHVTRTCVRGWASSYPGLVHRLSGGLDSSIVLSCLRDLPTHAAVTCITEYAAGPASDERRFARLAAEHLGFPLIEHRLEREAVDLEGVLRVQRAPKPWPYLHYLQFGRLEAQLAAAHGATAIFSGSGGDALFYQSRARAAVIDFALLCGLRPALWHVALDAARIERLPIWTLLHDALTWRRSSAARNSLAEFRARSTVVEPSVIETVAADDTFVSRAVQLARRLPPGKRWHVESLAIPTTFYDPVGSEDDPERVSPLTSQPLVELCLRIPTYVLVRGGSDRALARQAFTPDLPREVVQRRTKGRITSQAKELYDRNLPFIRDMLLDGFLVKNGLLNRAKLEQALTPRASLTSVVFAEILSDHLSTEAWLRGWVDMRQQAAA